MNHERRKGMRAAAVLVTALAVAACDDAAGPDALDDAYLLDAALVAADATLEDIGTWSQPFGFGPLGVAAIGEGPGRPGGHHGVGGTLSGTRSVTFYDADGNEQEAYDPLTTATIHFVSEVSGEVARGDWSATIDRTRDMTISGLEGEETHRTWNGSGSETVSRSRHTDDGDQSFTMSGTFEYADVVVPIPGSDPRYPVSGTITREMTVTVINGPFGDRTRTVTIVITFDGDSTATILVNGEEMEIDLDAREGGHPLRHRGDTGG